MKEEILSDEYLKKKWNEFRKKTWKELDRAAKFFHILACLSLCAGVYFLAANLLLSYALTSDFLTRLFSSASFFLLACTLSFAARSERKNILNGILLAVSLAGIVFSGVYFFLVMRYAG